MSETGHAKNVENFKRQKSFVESWGAKYNSPNTLLKLPSLTAKATAAAAAIEAVRTALIPRKTVSTAREEAFAPLGKLVTRIVGMLEASGASEAVVEDARTFARKVKGMRAAPRRADNPETVADEASSSISASQTSYTQIVEHFDSLLAIIAAQTVYAPNEDELKITVLTALAADLRTKNDAAIAAETAYQNALAARDTVLYADESGLYDIAVNVKKYVRSAFGADSPEYDQLQDLEFKNHGR